MQSTAKYRKYWSRNLKVTALMLTIWFVATFGVGYFARELNNFTIFGFPFGYYMSAQGSLIIYVAIIGFYAYYMNKLDKEYGVNEGAEK